MAGNVKALHLVLDLRKKQENTALEHYIAAKNKVASYKDQIAQIDGYKQSYIDDMQRAGMNGFSAQRLLTFQDFLNKLDAIKARQEYELQLCIADMDKKNKLYLQAQKNRKIIESLLEKHKQQRIKAELIKEQKLLDEFVVAHAARRSSHQS